MGKISSELKNQSKAILVMLGLALVAVLAMIMLTQLLSVTHNMSQLGAGNDTGSINWTVTTTVYLFIAAFALFGSFAAITALVILIKAIVGVVRGLG